MEESKKELKRINIRIPEYMQDFFKEQGEKYSMPYSNYIVFVLTQHYENEQNKKLVTEFNETLKSLNTTAGNVTAEEMMSRMKEIMTKINELEK